MSKLKSTVQVVNESGLEPQGRAVLLKAYEPEFANTVIEIPLTARERSMMNETRAIVMAVGPECWNQEKAPRAVVGDKVLVSKYSGTILIGPWDGEVYRMVNEKDIYCKIVRERDTSGLAVKQVEKAAAISEALRREKRNLDEDEEVTYG